MRKKVTPSFYEQYAHARTKKRKKSFAKLFIVLFCILLFVGICIGIGVALKPKNDELVYGGMIYLISVGEFDSKEQADILADELESHGGAGFVYCETKYEVVAFAYKSKTDAENVIQSLSNNGTTAKIVELSFPKIVKKLDSNALQMMNVLEETFDELYSISVKIDKGEVSELVAYDNLAQIKTELIAQKKNYESSAKPGDIVIFEKLEELILQCDNVLSNSFSQNIFSSYFKKLCVMSIVFEYDISQMVSKQ